MDFTKIKDHALFQPVAKLTLLSILSLSVLLSGMYKTNSLVHFYLTYNLFLGAIPWCVAAALLFFSVKSKWLGGLAFCVWLLFLPNSAYMLTDIFHINDTNKLPYWADFLVILPFCFTSLFFGIYSMQHMQQWIRERFQLKHMYWFIPLVSFLSAFGVYLGRFLRWNSWDIAHKPVTLFLDIADRFVHPTLHGRTWAFTLIIGFLIWFLYLVIVPEKHSQKQ